MEITKELAKILHEDVKNAVKAVAVKHGLTLNPSSASYGSDNFKLKVEFAVPISELKNIPKVTQQMLEYGMAPRGTKFSLRNGDQGVITKARNLKYEVVINEKNYLVRFENCILVK